MSIRQSILLRVRIAFLFIVLICGAIVVRIFYLQNINGEKWKKKGKDNGLAFRSITAMRGNILTEDGSLLATSTMFYQLAIDPTVADEETFTKGVDSLAFMLAKTFKEKPSKTIKTELLLARQEKKRYKLLVEEPITYQQKNLVVKFPILREGRRKGGVILEKTQQRLRPFGDLAKRTVGFIQEDTGGLVNGRGLEYTYHAQLAGTNGEAIFQRMAGGAWKPVGDGEQIRPEDGIDLVTTIDIHLQEIVDKSLRQALIKNNADYGCAILMEVQTGEIKAIVNLGKEGGQYVENNNYAVGDMGLSEPGSTFKMATMTALLEETNIELTDTVQTGNGRYKFAENAEMTDVKEGGYGKIMVRDIFEKSSNIGTSKMVFKYFREKPQKFYDYLEKFHLTKPLGFQMSGEANPMIKKPTDKSWSATSLPWMSVGYELRLAPIHTLAFCNALANEGRLLQPLIVKAIMRGNKVVESYTAKTLVPKIASDKTLQTMRMLMEGVVEKGTATNIKTAEYRIAGKTGTAEKVEKGAYTEKHYTSFVGYFPSDAPKYSCIVIIDNPKTTSQYGALVAAPVFKEIADFAYRSYLMNNEFKKTTTYLKPPLMRGGNRADIELISNTLGFKIDKELDETTEWAFGRVRNDSLLLATNKVFDSLVPNVVGMTVKDAIFLLENRGLGVAFFGKGKVTHQSLRAGTKITKGTKIVLTLGN
jgi:cell division protein FtsI (penicillin-binding protein 3)